MRILHSLGLMVALLIGCVPSQSESISWIGSDFSAWKIVGGKADFRFEKGVLSGAGATGGNAFLVSRKSFTDFELKCLVRIH